MKLLVIGGVAAGTKAAAKFKRVNPDAEVTIVTKGKDISYAGCGLPYYLGGAIADKGQLIVNTPEKFSDLTGAMVYTQREVTALDPREKKATAKNLRTGTQETYEYDACVIATGASPVVPPLPGMSLPGVFVMRTPDDAIEARDYLEKNGGVGGSTTDLDSSRYTLSSSSGAKSASQLVTQWNDFYNQLKNFETLQQEMEKEWEEEVWKPYLEQLEAYNKKYAEYQEKYNKWHDDFIGGLNTWYEQMQNAKTAYTDALDNLPAKLVPDEEDPKYQWYTNLWFRMGGISEAEKQDNQNNYKILDDYYMYNDEWLQFALEHGIITMEQVQYQEEGETLVEQMNQYAWVSIQYGNCADLYEETDDVAIAKAEAEYQRKTTEIQAKDKKYDTDLKKLDTEHSALQTEYDSIKSVIEKNVERSFKAFS